MNKVSLACIVLSAALLGACRTMPPPVARPSASGPPGPTPEVGSGPPQTSPPPAPDNEDIAVAKAVRASLRSNQELGPAGEEIRVKVSKGVVTLRGTLPPGADRTALVTRISKMPGVDGIVDELVQKP